MRELVAGSPLGGKLRAGPFLFQSAASLLNGLAPLPPQPLLALWGAQDRILRPPQKRAAQALLAERLRMVEGLVTAFQVGRKADGDVRSRRAFRVVDRHASANCEAE